MKQSKGLFINVEGLDFSFKETNTKRLYNYIKDNITEKVILLSFPNYESKSADFVKKYLNGEYGKASEVDPYQASVCYAIDRFDTISEMDIKKKLEEGYIVITDRYTGSNLIFQTTKLKDAPYKLTNDYIDWVIDFEYNKLKLPKEDITIYMDMPIKVSHKLMMERKLKNGMSTDGHEENYEFMSNVELIAKKLIIPRLDYKVVSCVDQDLNIRTEDEIFEEILKILKNNLSTIK